MDQLEKIIFYKMDKAIKTYRQFSQNDLKSKGYDITVDQWIVLKCLMQNPDITQTGIAEKVFKDNASVTRMVDILVKSEYLNREVDPENRRRVKLTITEKGNDALVEMEPIIVKNRSTALLGISTEDIEAAKRVMQKIAANCKTD
jgi:MarR family transcriptional regulator for hemolysin